jgi:hypothetical protein
MTDGLSSSRSDYRGVFPRTFWAFIWGLSGSYCRAHPNVLEEDQRRRAPLRRSVQRQREAASHQRQRYRGRAIAKVKAQHRPVLTTITYTPLLVVNRDEHSIQQSTIVIKLLNAEVVKDQRKLICLGLDRDRMLVSSQTLGPRCCICGFLIVG